VWSCHFTQRRSRCFGGCAVNVRQATRSDSRIALKLSQNATELFRQTQPRPEFAAVLPDDRCALIGRILLQLAGESLADHKLFNCASCSQLTQVKDGLFQDDVGSYLQATISEHLAKKRTLPGYTITYKIRFHQCSGKTKSRKFTSSFSGSFEGDSGEVADSDSLSRPTC